MIQLSKEQWLTRIVIAIFILVFIGFAFQSLSFLPKFVRDQIRRYHVNQLGERLRERAAEGSLPHTNSYKKNDGFGWDYSSVNPNAEGVYFMDFLRKQSEVPVDPINNAQGNITCAAGRCDGRGYAYFYFCYKFKPPCQEFQPKAWWGRIGCGDFAVVGARLETDDGVYSQRIDNIVCR